MGVEEGGCYSARAAFTPRPWGDQQAPLSSLGGSDVHHVA